MRFQEIYERCWSGYQQQGMKKKGDRMVPNCVPVAEVKTGPEMTLNDLLYTAAAKAMHQAGLEGVPMDYEEAIKKAAKIYKIPYTPSELPKLLAQRAEIDRKLAMLKQGKQVAKARRKEKLAPTPAGAEEYWKTHALPTDRIKPPAKTLEEYTGDPFIDNAARELLGMVLMFGVPFAIGTYVTLRNKLRKYQGREIIDALERKGVTMNRQTYAKVKPVLDRFDQAIRDDDGDEAKALAKQIEQMIIMGKLSAPDPQTPDSALAAKEKELAEDLKKWFKEKWVRFGPDGKIRGACARGSSKEGKPKCLPQAKAHALGKKGRASAAAKKRREDPNPERRGPAKNVATKVKEALGLYGPFTVTINTGERPQSRTKTKKFKREDDAILWAEDWLEDFPQYSFATAQVTDPDGNVVWATDESLEEQGGAQVKRPAPRTRGEFVPPPNSSDSYKAGHDLGVKLAHATNMTQVAKTQMVQTQMQQQAIPADFFKGYKKGFSDVAAYIRNQQDANRIRQFAKFKSITPDQIQKIVARYSAGETSPQIAPDFGLDAQQILRLIDKQSNRDEIVQLNRQNRKGKIGPQRQLAFDETQVREQNDWDDADEFGMPGSEFFPDDDRLRDGDYVRDRQDGEYGEIFRMSGDPSERRVRILDRDGKGWYISPERLVVVDRTDPDIMKYFGKRRQRDMDESAVAEGFEYGNRVQHPKYGAGQVIQVYSNGTITVNFPNYPDPIDKKPGVQSNFAPGDKDYQSLKPMVSEKQDACYRKVKSRYKVWPSAYASGALVQCRKKGAANWGTGGKKK